MLFVIRHAESVENAAKYDGFYPDPRPYGGVFAHALSWEIVGLTPRGFRQADWLGTHLTTATAGEPGSVYCSTYRRSIDTASIAFPNLPEGWPRQSGLLDEQHYGDATYMTKRELFAAFPDTAEQRRTCKHLWNAPGGESLSTHVAARAAEFIENIKGVLIEGAHVIAVTHQTTILAVRSILENQPIPDLLAQEKRGKTPNAAVFTYQVRASHIVLWDVIAPPI